MMTTITVTAVVSAKQSKGSPLAVLSAILAVVEDIGRL